MFYILIFHEAHALIPSRRHRKRRKLKVVKRKKNLRMWSNSKLATSSPPQGSCFIILCLKLNIIKLSRVRRVEESTYATHKALSEMRKIWDNFTAAGTRSSEKWLNFVMHLFCNAESIRARVVRLQTIVDSYNKKLWFLKKVFIWNFGNWFFFVC